MRLTVVKDGNTLLIAKPQLANYVRKGWELQRPTEDKKIVQDTIAKVEETE